MAESGVLYTCPDDLLERVPLLMEQAGVSIQPLPPPEFGEGCERSFALRMSRDRGTVELIGFFYAEERQFIVGIGGAGRGPLRWLRDYRLCEKVKEVLIEGGMKRLA